MYYILLLLIMLYIVGTLFVNKKYSILNEILLVGIFIFFIVIMGIRYDVGIDYATYENMFHLNYDNFIYEPIYSWLTYFVKVLFDKFYYLTFIMALITNIFIYLGLKKHRLSKYYLGLALLIYFGDLAFIYVNVMRQGVAVAIFFYASAYIEERKFKKYIMFILLAAGFHYSILLMIPVYFLNKIYLSKGKYILSILVAYLMIGIGGAQQILNAIVGYLGMYSKYYNSSYIVNNEINILAIGVLAKAIISIILVLFSSKTMGRNREIEFYKIGILLNVLSLSSFMFDRIGIYFSVFSLVGIPRLIMGSDKKDRKYMFVFTVIIFASLYIKTLIIETHLNHLEYKTVYEYHST